MNAQAHLMEQYNKANYEHKEIHAEVEKHKYDSNKLKELKLAKLKLKDKQYFVRVTYTSSAYGTVGAGKSTAVAINQPIDSNTVNLTVLNELSVTTGPSSTSAVVDRSAIFNIVASKTDGTTDGINYQWNVNGDDVDDGTNTTTFTENRITKKFNASDQILQCDIPSDATDVTIKITAGAGSHVKNSNTAGGGGPG